MTETVLEFVFKHHVLHNRDSDRFPRSFWERLPAERRAQSLWWEGGFECRERVFVSGADLDRYLSEFVAEHLPAAPQSPSGRLRRRLRAGLASRRRR